MKIIIINGSARKGNTLTAINALIKGASEKNEIEVIEPDKLQIAPCKGCGACQCHKGCVDNDDTNPTIDKIAAADMILFTTPVYWWGMSAQLKLVIDNYPEDQIEMLEVQNNLENPELGSRQVPFGRELYIEREDFMEEPVRKYFRMFPGNEVRLMNAYFVTCTGCEKDENGNITVIHGTYDPESKGGNSPDGRKVKGTIHWVAAKTAVKAECRLYENLIDEEKGVYNEDGSMNLNPNSLTVLKECYLEPSLKDAKAYDSFQFVRNGFFCVDAKDSKEDALVFNRIVSLKSSFKLPAAK